LQLLFSVEKIVMSILPSDGLARDSSWGKPHTTPAAATTDTTVDLIRGATADLRKFVTDRRYEVAELNTRMARVEDELQQQTGRGKSLTVLGGVVALLSFLSTTVVWQISHRAAAIQTAVGESTLLVQQAAAAAQVSSEQFSTDLAAQTAIMNRVAGVLADVEAAGQKTQTALAALGKDASTQLEDTQRIRDQLVIANNGLAEIRRDVADRLARHQQIDAGERATLLRNINDSMTRVESVMLGQASELQTQKQQLDASALRLHETRRMMLGEATQAVSVQLEGLRQILDGLRSDMPDATATTTAETVEGETELRAEPVAIENVSTPATVPAPESDEFSGVTKPESTTDDGQPLEAASTDDSVKR
jgi:hypothetical protein